jgi:hypothetical protein
MPTRIELLKQAGFSDGEIGDWATAERQRMREAGFTDSEIDNEFGVTRPPKQVPAAFIERLKQGNSLRRIIGAAAEYARDYFGDEPLGFSPENQRFLRKFGVFGDLGIPVGTVGDAALRTLSAGTAGLGAAVGQAVEEGHDAVFGPGPYGKGKAARDFAQLAQIAGLLSTASGRKPGAARAPAPKAAVAEAPVSALPRAEDFRNAAAVISGTAASFPTEQKLLRLWTDHGIPPAEVAEDALRDRTIRDVIRSDSEKVPDAYAGSGDTATATSVEPNAIAPLAESAQTDRAAVAGESRAAAAEAEDKSAANPNAPGLEPVIAEAKPVRLRAPPRKPQRPFEEDYPGATITGPDGQLEFDIEGRNLGAKFIAGRRVYGEADQPLSPEEIKGAMKQLGIRLIDIPPDAHGGDPLLKKYMKSLRAEYQGDPQPGGPPDQRVYVNTGPKAPDRNFVIAHEFAHAIDHLTGMLISSSLTPEEIAELRAVYGEIKTRPNKDAPRPQPEHFGYSGADINRELAAEGIRAYLTNPNYFKTVAPKTAAKIRDLVNENPYLKRVLQFNSLIAAGLIGVGARNQDRDDQ